MPEVGDKSVGYIGHRMRDAGQSQPQFDTWFRQLKVSDQVDALSQYLDWITEHPNLEGRPSMAIAQGCDGHGRPVRPWWGGQVGSAGWSMRYSY